MYEITSADHGRSRSSRAITPRYLREKCCARSSGSITHSINPLTTLFAAITNMTTAFTDANKVAGFIIQRGRIGFEAFTAG
jgi:hypothetical protein